MKKIFSWSLFLLLFLMGCDDCEKNSNKDKIEYTEFQKEVIKNCPEILDAETNFEKAVILRNHVYSIVELREGKIGYPITLENYKQLYKKERGGPCGVIGYTFATLCEEFNIPVRVLQLFSEEAYDGENIDNHLTTEVFIEGKWIVMDSTFNVSYINKAKEHVGYFEIKKTLQENGNIDNITIEYDGFKPLPDKATAENYYIPIETLLHVINIQFE
jgi:hypothetical protein